MTGAAQHVLWIMCDELRADALGCYGNDAPEIATPHIDALASGGVLFERAYTVSPVCVPARTALLTGVRPGTTGVYGNEAYAPGAPPDHLPASFPELLADAGWTTLDFGKEHVPPALSPWQRQEPAGSDMRELMADAQRASASVLRTPGIGHVVGARLPEGADFSAGTVTANVCAALEAADGPFVIRASYLQPHTPVVVPEPWAGRYAGVPLGGEVRPSDVGTFEREFGLVNRGAEMEPGAVREARELYYGAVAWLDDQVGRLLEQLDQLGLRDSTVVVLTTDHGVHLGEDGAFGKHTFAPRSHRIPLIISAPGSLVAGQRRGDLATSEDLAPTLLRLCGHDVPEHMEGRDLFGAAAPEHIVSVVGYGAPQSRAFPNLDAGRWIDGRGWPQRLCVRTVRYRLDLNTRIDGRPVAEDEWDVVLTDGLVDPDERHNVAADQRYAAVRDRLLTIALEATHELAVPDHEAVFDAFDPPAPVIQGEQ